jgi:hypothetical protein
VADATLRERVVNDAAWLRALARSGRDEVADEIRRTVLDAAGGASRAGTAVEIRDAALDRPGPLPRPTTACRDGLAAVLDRMAGRVREVSVRVEPEPDGLRIFVVAPELAAAGEDIAELWYPSV